MGDEQDELLTFEIIGCVSFSTMVIRWAGYKVADEEFCFAAQRGALEGLKSVVMVAAVIEDSDFWFGLCKRGSVLDNLLELALRHLQIHSDGLLQNFAENVQLGLAAVKVWSSHSLTVSSHVTFDDSFTTELITPLDADHLSSFHRDESADKNRQPHSEFPR